MHKIMTFSSHFSSIDESSRQQKKGYSFLIIGMIHLQKNITFSYNAAILFYHC